MKKYGILSLKILLWIIGSVIFLVLLVFVLIEVPAVQDFARKKAVNYLQNKIGTKVEIGHISLDLPKLVVLENIYFEDQKKDTLLAGDTLRVDISMLKLLHKEVEINEVDLRGITANIQRTMPDSTFNFDYIIKAFVSEQKSPAPKDTTSSMKFSVEKINLDRIRTRFKDAVTASNIDVYLGHFDTRITRFNLDSMAFTVPKINLSGVNAVVIQNEPPLAPKPMPQVEAESNQPPNMSLQLGTIDLKKIKVNYQNSVAAMKANVNLGQLAVESDALDLKKQVIALKSLNLNNSDILFQLGKKQEAKTQAAEAGKEVKAQGNSWKFKVGGIALDNNNIRFDNFNSPVQKRGMDYAHMDIKDLKLDLGNLLYTTDTISGMIRDGSFREKSGFDLRRLHTNFFYGATQTRLDDLDLRTSSTRIKDKIRLNYPSIASLSKNLGDLRLDANLTNTRVGFHDILVFVPTLAAQPPFSKNPNGYLNVNTRINGALHNLNIPNLEISGLGTTYVKASARITGLPDMNKAYFDVKIDKMSSRRADIAGFLPPAATANIRLPEAFSLNGFFKGGMTNFNTDLNLNSSYGSAKAIASYNASVKGRETYKANVRTFNFNVGRLLKKDTTMGRITLAADISGTGIDPKKLNARVTGRVIKAEFNKYTYRNLNLDASAVGGAYKAKARMSDPNINFDLNAAADMSKKYPAVNLKLDLDSINLQQLHFASTDMRFHGNLVADLPTADPDYLNGNIFLTNALIVRSGERLELDSVSIASTATADGNSLRLRSQVLSADVRGKYKLTELGTAFQDFFSKYFSTGAKSSEKVKYAPQNLTFNASLVNDPLLQKFAPALKELTTVNITGNFNSEQQQLVLKATAPHIVYGTNTVDNVQLNVNTAGEALQYALNLGQVTGGQFQILNTSITGAAQNNTLTTDIQVRDKNKRQYYRIAGALKSAADAFQFNLQPDGLVLNYQPWNVSQDNLIQFGKSGVLARNFVISNANQQLSVNTNPPSANSPLTVAFNNFKIETLTQIAKKDSLLVGGTINGSVLVRNLEASPVFTSDLNVGDFNFRGDTVGNIALKVNNETANTFAANVGITGKGNQVDLNGFYYTNNSSFNLNLNIANLAMKSIQGFTMGNLQDASGSLNGQMQITGTADAPAVRGGINFNKVAFNVSMLNSYFRIPDNRITFDQQGIGFNDFTLVDSANNRATINGMVYTKTFRDYRFNLSVNTNNFQVLNSKATDNALYYGKLLIDTRLRISGTPTAPKVDGNLKIDPKTNLTVVLPQTDPAIEERQGIVEFVDKDHPELASTLTADTVKNNQSDITGMDISVNLTIDSTAEFNLIVDAANGDFLKLRGYAQLTGGIDPSGKTSLTGTYQMQQGAYQLSFNFLQRRFDIKPGSTITWQGDPMDADLNITALYTAETAPLDLVQAQLGDAPPGVVNTYKQKLPFQVNLIMKGQLMKPDLSFDIILPERNYNVSTDITNNVTARLTQLRQEPSELNKQVFALLLLNRFVSDNPFQSSAGGGGVESLARQSASKLLSQQLNNLAGNLIGGVELNFDLESSEDYTTGQMKNRTDLNVGVSKRLLNDRLKVTVGSNFELEGPRQPNRSTNNIAGNVEVEYQLSKDGRYLLRAYQKNEYQVALQGQVVETGVGFVITMDYNKFKQIFQQSKKRQQNRQVAEVEAK